MGSGVGASFPLDVVPFDGATLQGEPPQAEPHDEPQIEPQELPQMPPHGEQQALAAGAYMAVPQLLQPPPDMT